MYTKEQLEQMAIPDLMEVAAQIGVKVKQDDDLEKVIYDILDKAAIDSAADMIHLLSVMDLKYKLTKLSSKVNEPLSSEEKASVLKEYAKCHEELQKLLLERK